jgi:hypothetical protein
LGAARKGAAPNQDKEGIRTPCDGNCQEKLFGSFMTYLSSFHIKTSSSTIRVFASTIELGLEGPSLERFSKPRSIAGSAVQAADFLLKSPKFSKSPRRIMTPTLVVVQNLLSILYLPYLRTIMP